MEPHALGAELRALRVLRGLSVVAAARRAGVSRVSLHRWESGEQEPKGKALAGLLKALFADPREQAALFAAASGGKQTVLDATPLGAPAHPGLIVRALREGQALSQTQLAQSIGVSQAAIAKWETGRAMPSAETLLRASAVLKAGDLDLREDSLDLYDPIVDPYDARLRLRDLRFLNHPLQPARLLALERELWSLAARNKRWEEPLAECLAWRAQSAISHGDHTTALATARRALRLAASDGCWDAVFHAGLALNFVRSSRGASPDDQARFWLDYAGRVRNPIVRSFALNQVCVFATCGLNRSLFSRTIPLVRESLSQAEPDEIVGMSHPMDPMDEYDMDQWDAFHAFELGDIDDACRLANLHSNGWEQKLANREDRFRHLYLNIHWATGERIPEAALKIFDAAARAATTWYEKNLFHRLSPHLGTYMPPTSKPR